jgi:hypothetical protein
MKNLIVFALFAVATAGGFLAVLNHYEGRIAEEQFERARAEVRGDFAYDNGWARDTPDPEKYKAEIKGLLNRYFSRVGKMYEEAGRKEDVDAWVHKWEGEKAEGKLSEAKIKNEKDFQEAFNLSKEAYEKMRSGGYEPWYAIDAGGLRFDIMSAKAEGGEIVFDYVIWGANGSAKCSYQIEAYTPEMLAAKARKKAEEEAAAAGEDEKKADKKKDEKKPEPKLSTVAITLGGVCDPFLGVDRPDSYIADFPPGANIGRFAMQKLPGEAVYFDLEFRFKRGGVTGQYDAKARFEDFKVPAEWKLRPGEFKPEKEVKNEVIGE